MKLRLSLLTFFLGLIVACSPTDTTNAPNTPIFAPSLPTNPDEALGATAHLTNALNAALYLEAEGYLTELPNGLPPVVRGVLDTFGFHESLVSYSPTCDVSRTDSDGDGDGIVLHTYTVECAAIVDGSAFALFTGGLSAGDPDDADPLQAFAYGYRFNTFGIVLSTYDPNGNLINTNLTLNGAINYDADQSLVRNEADFQIHLQHSLGIDPLATFIFYPAHPVAITATVPDTTATPTLSLTPQLGNYSTPHWQVNYGDYVNVAEIALPSGDLVYDPTCASLAFTSGRLVYTDTNGATLEVAYGGCDTPPAFSTTLLP